jgi:alcohol dehydrogenase class IV
MKTFRCLLPASVEFGPGKLQELAGIVQGKSVLLLSDKGVRECGVAARVGALGRTHAASVREFFEVPSEPTEDEVTAVVASLAEAEVEVIVAAGGGSVMDTAKLVAVMLRRGPTLAEMFDGRLPKGRKTVLVMIPTTAGTGSEATPNAIVYRQALNLKAGIVCEAFMPDRVILDPELLLGLPPAVTAATGMDALCHALECYVSNKANPFSDLFAVEATRLVFRSLRRCVARGDDLQARSDLLLAAFYGGVCIASSGTNAVHALSYPLGGRYRIAHGVSNAALLAPVFAFHKDRCTARLAAIAHLTGADVQGRNDGEKAQALVTALADLSRDLGIPARLGDLGVPAEDLDSIVDAAFQVKRLLANNPVPLSRDDIRTIYQTIL